MKSPLFFLMVHDLSICTRSTQSSQKRFQHNSDYRFTVIGRVVSWSLSFTNYALIVVVNTQEVVIGIPLCSRLNCHVLILAQETLFLTTSPTCPVVHVCTITSPEINPTPQSRSSQSYQLPQSSAIRTPSVHTKRSQLCSSMPSRPAPCSNPVLMCPPLLPGSPGLRDPGLGEVKPRPPQNPKPWTQNPKPKTLNPKPWTQNPKPWTQNPKPKTLNPKPWTQNPEPKTLNPKPWTQNPEPKTLNPKPWTQNPEPKTLNPKPWTQNPEPKTLNPKPKTLNPKPKTQNPKHKTQNYEPKTQNPEPKTLNPKPKTQNPES